MLFYACRCYTVVLTFSEAIPLGLFSAYTVTTPKLILDRLQNCIIKLKKLHIPKKTDNPPWQLVTFIHMKNTRPYATARGWAQEHILQPTF